MPDLEHLKDPFEQTYSRPGSGGMVFTYIKPTQVMDRLDEVFGVGGWTCEYRLLYASDTRAVMCARISAPGIQPVEGIGEAEAHAGMSEFFKAAASDALKRAAVNLGVGRYLYEGWEEQRAAASPVSAQRTVVPQSGSSSSGSRAVGDTWIDNKGDLRIQCPEHGAWWALTTRDGQAKCKKRVGDNEWCPFVAPLSEDALATMMQDGKGSTAQQAAPSQPVVAMLNRLRQLQSEHGWTNEHLAKAFDIPEVSNEIIFNAFKSGMTPDDLNELAIAQM